MPADYDTRHVTFGPFDRVRREAESYASAMAQAIPTSVDDITPEWLTGVLAESGVSPVAVIAVEATRIGEGVGFIGEIHRIALSYEDPATAIAAGAPASVVSKIPTQDPGGRMIGTMLRLYEKESGFYRYLAEDSPVHVPVCFYNGADVESQQWCLLLEDMSAYDVGINSSRAASGRRALLSLRWRGSTPNGATDERAISNGFPVLTTRRAPGCWRCTTTASRLPWPGTPIWSRNT